MSLPRHGARPLAFTGRVLVQAASRHPALPVWSDIGVFETSSHRIVTEIRHQWRGEPPLGRRYAVELAACDDALVYLHGHDPLRDLPVEILYGAAPHSDDLAAHEAALACAGLLRRSWREMLDLCFGPASAPIAAIAHPRDARITATKEILR
jgi:hypothetical protein